MTIPTPADRRAGGSRLRQFETRKNLIAQLKACNSLLKGKRIHQSVVECGQETHVYVASALMRMYARFGSMQQAKKVFDSLQNRNVVCWNVLILGYAENGEDDLALDLFSRMRLDGLAVDASTFVAVLKACTVKTDVKCGRKVHLLASGSGCDLDMNVQSTVLNLYATCGMLAEARRVFDSVKQPDVVCWNALMLGYATNGEGEAALEVFSQMRRRCTPDARTFAATFQACTDIATREEGVVKWESKAKGNAVFVLASEADSDIYLNNILMNMYAKCGSINDAAKVFSSMRHLDVVSWNTLILGYAEAGKGDMALEAFSRMRREGYAPDNQTFVAVLKACGMVGAAELGRRVHAEVCSSSLETLDVLVMNSLVDFYARCGCMSEAEQVFDSQRVTSSVATWNALITGYSRNGDTEGVFRIYDRMKEEASCLYPDGITFLSLLTACSQAALIDQGKHLFQIMCTKHGIRPEVEHYTCMIDMFGRANKLDAAMDLLRSMPMSPNSVTWTTLQGSCRKWKKLDLGRLVFESSLSLLVVDSAAYVLMANTLELLQ